MADRTERNELADLLAGGGERLDIEYKAWMDTAQNEVRANLARHIAALANHGGGYLVFGIDDKTRQPQGRSDLDPRLFSQDAIAGIVKRYLDPRVQVQVEQVEQDGVQYPVVVVPSHAGRPVLAIADGPQDDKRQPAGIRQGDLYIRIAGPASERIRSPDDWNGLLDRCLAHRADLLGKIMRQTIARPGRASQKASALLRAGMDDTAADFQAQCTQLAARADEAAMAQLRAAGAAHSVLGYAFVADDGEPLAIDDPRGLNERVAIAMRHWADNGWLSFFPLSVPERAPQVKVASLLGQDRVYLEGMRFADAEILHGVLDYWRIYEAGLGVIAESYREDANRIRNRGATPYLTVLQIVWRLHSVLAHARLAGQETPGVQQLLVRMDWRGLAGRMLWWDHDGRCVSAGRMAGERFVKEVPLSWAELRDSYFESLRRVCLPVLTMFPTDGPPPSEWLTRERVLAEFGRFSMANARLFDD